MDHVIYEFKAKTLRLEELEKKLLSANPEFRGEDHQVDTYFVQSDGRLKLREGNIENALIYYHRPDRAAIKTSRVQLYKTSGAPELKTLLTAALGIKVIVDKIRRIYFLDNVKVHFDRVRGLGTFIEVEAISRDGLIPEGRLKEQSEYYQQFFEIDNEDLVAYSYSDLVLQKNQAR